MQKVSKKGYSVVYDTAVNVIKKFEEESLPQRLYEEAQADVNRYLSCDLLIIDTLDRACNSLLQSVYFYHIINTRLIERKTRL